MPRCGPGGSPPGGRRYSLLCPAPGRAHSYKQNDNNDLSIPDKLEYVLGFAFNPELNKVVLIKKKRPSNQKGLLNGVGGKIVNGESFKTAMCREFAEETSYLSNIDDWEYVAKMMTYNGYNIYCFKTNRE